jgi:ATPase family associated with various cellular activities (AAA)
MVRGNPHTRLVYILLKRLRRETEFIAAEKAIDAGVLRADARKIGGHQVIAFKPGPLAYTSDEAGIRRTLENARRTVSHQSIRYELDGDEIMMTFEDEAAGVSNEKSFGQTVDSEQPSPFDIRELMRMVNDSADPPRAADIAALLVLTRPVSRLPYRFSGVVAILRRSRPIIIVSCNVRGFEDTFLSLLKRGLVTLGATAKVDGYRDWRKKDPQFEYVRNPRNKVICFAGQQFDERNLDDRIGYAAQSPYPILVVVENEEKIPQQLMEASEVHFRCGFLTASTINETIEMVLGRAPLFWMDEPSCNVLSLADLELAIRPGVLPEQAIEILLEIVYQKQASKGSKDQAPDRDQYGGGSTTKTRKDQHAGTGSEVIQPVTNDNPGRGAFVPRVETLAGYGEATTWAMALKDDLALWRSGSVSWSDMSTKLLLSGPPGTGKTLFAKALCNTLKVPLIATSVAIWLEAGHLGDVLMRMSKAFNEARSHSPCILFVDEIDGIGSRGKTNRDYEDYWNSVVNRALELFDGLTKSTAVILLAATNNPTVIDRALLRSGRLERHIAISIPGIDTLCGIIRHHLGTDTDNVILSAPKVPEQRDLNFAADVTDATAIREDG